MTDPKKQKVIQDLLDGATDAQATMRKTNDKVLKDVGHQLIDLIHGVSLRPDIVEALKVTGEDPMVLATRMVTCALGRVITLCPQEYLRSEVGRIEMTTIMGIGAQIGIVGVFDLKGTSGD